MATGLAVRRPRFAARNSLLDHEPRARQLGSRARSGLNRARGRGEHDLRGGKLVHEPYIGDGSRGRFSRRSKSSWQERIERHITGVPDRRRRQGRTVDRTLGGRRLLTSCALRAPLATVANNRTGKRGCPEKQLNKTERTELRDTKKADAENRGAVRRTGDTHSALA